MKQKKSRKLLITMIVLITIIIITIGILIVVLTTDILKTNKDMFLKYAFQIVDEQLSGYYNKIENNSFEDKGQISFEILKNGEKLESLQYIENFNINYEGKVKISENKAEQNISINYPNNVKFPINYRQINNKIGLQTKYVGSKYIAVEEGKNLETDNISLPQINISKNVTENENAKETIQKQYLNIIKSNLKEESFTKETNGDLTGYKLIISSQEVKNLLMQLLNTIKTDETMLKYISTETVNNLFKEIENIDIQENLTMIVYQKDKELNQISINIPNNLNIQINKNKTENQIKYENIVKVKNDEENEIEYKLTIEYTGLQGMQTIEEKYELDINIPLEAEVEEIEAKPLSFKEEKDLIELLIADAKSNRMLENEDTEKLSYEDIEKTLNTDTDESYSKINLSKETDDTYKITFKNSKDKFILDASGKIIDEQQNAENEENSDSKDVEFINYKYKISNSNTFVDNIEIDSLDEENAIILTSQDQSYVENLLNKITERLKLVEEKIMSQAEINQNQKPQLILNPYNSILTTNMSGEALSNLSEMEINAFNEKFNLYKNSNQRGGSVKGLLTVIENNNASQENGTKKIEEINFEGQEYEVTEQNITLIKSNINVEDNYKVEFETDETTGLIYRVVINKK